LAANTSPAVTPVSTPTSSSIPSVQGRQVPIPQNQPIAEPIPEPSSMPSLVSSEPPREEVKSQEPAYKSDPLYLDLLVQEKTVDGQISILTKKTVRTG